MRTQAADEPSAGAQARPRYEELLSRAGACGCPACEDPHCQVDPWHCHGPDCTERVRPAPHTQQRDHSVLGYPKMYCSRRCADLENPLLRAQIAKVIGENKQREAHIRAQLRAEGLEP